MCLLTLFFGLCFSGSLISYQKYIQLDEVNDPHCVRELKFLVTRRAFRRGSVYLLTGCRMEEYDILVKDMKQLGWNISTYYVSVLDAKWSSVTDSNDITTCRVLRTNDVDDEISIYITVRRLHRKPAIEDKMYTHSFPGLFVRSCIRRDWKIPIIKVDLRRW